jgi:predicted transcriptional regulator
MESEARRRRAGPEPRHNPAKGTVTEALCEAFRTWGGTQAELAMKMGTQPSVVSRLLSGAVLDPHWSTIESFANAIGKRVTLTITDRTE